MKGKALRKHSLHEKTAASVLLKLFISIDDATPLTPPKPISRTTLHQFCFSEAWKVFFFKSQLTLTTGLSVRYYTMEGGNWCM